MNILVYFFRTPFLIEGVHLLLLYYYATLTLREGILVANGSNIKGWWIMHHYLSIAVSTTLLTWPNSDSYDAFLPLFILYGSYLCVVQILQYRYQIARLYQLRALEKANSMDVTNAETAQFRWSESMAFLLPFLYIGQFLQLYISYFMFNLWSESVTEKGVEWQVIIIGGLFGVLGMGNLVTTTIVLSNKWKKWRKASAQKAAKLDKKEK
eukprot:TRINITY_DN6446_c0_g1_i8.p1 TRINITY_DN6446_c0_g1~~TRINITY_DN6446_c0_g1_i8.p1  ORF type:complete len:210 (+),score=65.71 TRINITY_DN6446_c0_g1_i8:532-1161(+)